MGIQRNKTAARQRLSKAAPIAQRSVELPSNEPNLTMTPHRSIVAELYSVNEQIPQYVFNPCA
jgi:hypothetical protein